MMYEKTKKDDRQYRRLSAAVNFLEKQDALRKRAVELTNEADATYVGPKPNIHETRILEKLASSASLPAQTSSEENSAANDNASYEALMDDVFASLNREEGV